MYIHTHIQHIHTSEKTLRDHHAISANHKLRDDATDRTLRRRERGEEVSKGELFCALEISSTNSDQLLRPTVGITHSGVVV